MQRAEAITIISEYPFLIGHALGFNLLTPLHNEWLLDMLFCEADRTLQGHRGSYKTTCLSLTLALLMIIAPDKTVYFLRKTDTDIKEIVRQVRKMLENDVMKDLCRALWKRELTVVSASATELTTSIFSSSRGTAQLVASGINGSMTGKHFDYIFTDDIVNIQDRASKAERDHTKQIYQELQNIRNRGGRIYNTGTPWHKDDCFSLMPNPIKYDCYSTDLISATELERIRSTMTASLFAANYELKHISEDEVIFDRPRTDADPSFVEQGVCHIDAAYSGADYTAFTICKKHGDDYYIFGKMWRKHIDDVENEIIALRKRFNAGKIYCETNADKGYLAKDLRAKGERVSVYHESTNKYIKITSFLKSAWENVYFVAGTDCDYLNQILEYNENAEHDDAPDSAASIVRVLFNKREQAKTSMFL